MRAHPRAFTPAHASAPPPRSHHRPRPGRRLGKFAHPANLLCTGSGKLARPSHLFCTAPANLPAHRTFLARLRQICPTSAPFMHGSGKFASPSHLSCTAPANLPDQRAFSALLRQICPPIAPFVHGSGKKSEKIHERFRTGQPPGAHARTPGRLGPGARTRTLRTHPNHAHAPTPLAAWAQALAPAHLAAGAQAPAPAHAGAQAPAPAHPAAQAHGVNPNLNPQPAHPAAQAHAGVRRAPGRVNPAQIVTTTSAPRPGVRTHARLRACAHAHTCARMRAHARACARRRRRRPGPTSGPPRAHPPGGACVARN